MPNKPQTTRRVSIGSWPGMVGMAIAGIGAGLLVGLFAVHLLLTTEISTIGFHVVLSLLTLGAAVALWLTRNRYWRALAVGLSAFWVVAIVALVWDPWSTMDEGEIESAMAEAQASGNPAFYLGDEVTGHPLNDYYLDSSQANFLYGVCHTAPEDRGCGMWDVEIHTEWRDVTIGGDALAGCVRQEPVAGVPTVHLHHQVHIADQVVLFTGNAQITIWTEAESSLKEMLQMAREVRPVGDSKAATSLPPPSPAILAYVEQNCAPIP